MIFKFSSASQTASDWLSQWSCDLVLESGAELNECGICTGGTTGLSANEGIDACGVCGGDGSTCTDCAGVAFGESVTVCGQCVAKGDTGELICYYYDLLLSRVQNIIFNKN